MQNIIRFMPGYEFSFNHLYQVIQTLEVLIMRAGPPCQLPYAFDGIKFRTVWRQKEQLNFATVLFKPQVQILSMVISCIVQYYQRFLPSSSLNQKILEKRLERY